MPRTYLQAGQVCRPTYNPRVQEAKTEWPGANWLARLSRTFSSSVGEFAPRTRQSATEKSNRCQHWAFVCACASLHMSVPRHVDTRTHIFTHKYAKNSYFPTPYSFPKINLQEAYRILKKIGRLRPTWLRSDRSLLFLIFLSSVCCVSNYTVDNGLKN